VVSDREFGHHGEQRRYVGRALARVEFAIDGVDVHGHSFAIDPVGELAKGDVGRGIVDRHSSIVAGPSLGVDVGEIVAHSTNACGIGKWAMSRHDCVSTEVDDEIAGCDPVTDRPGPHEWCSFDEQDVAGVHDVGFWNVSDNVAGGVSGPDLVEFDG